MTMTKHIEENRHWYWVSDEEQKTLLLIAAGFGLTNRRGRAAGEPSIARLLQEMAAGNLIVVRPEPDL